MSETAKISNFKDFMLLPYGKLIVFLVFAVIGGLAYYINDLTIDNRLKNKQCQDWILKYQDKLDDCNDGMVTILKDIIVKDARRFEQAKKVQKFNQKTEAKINELQKIK